MTNLEGNPVAKLTVYELRHLGAHLAQSGCVAELHRLLSLSAVDGANAWYEAQNAKGSLDIYETDIVRAWQLTERESAHKIERREAAESVGLEMRYAFILASLHSIAKGVSPDLLFALVTEQEWTLDYALAYTRQMPDARQQVKSLTGLADRLSGLSQLEVLREALETAETIQNEFERAEVLIRLVPHLPAYLQDEALRAALEAKETYLVADWLKRRQDITTRGPIPDPEDGLAIALSELASNLPDELKTRAERQAVQLAWTKPSTAERAGVLIQLAPCLSAELKRQILLEALPVSQAVEDDKTRARLLALLAPQLAESGYKRDAVETAQAIQLESYRMRTLATIAGCLPEPMRDKTVCDMLEENGRHGWWGVETLADLASQIARLGYGRGALDVIQAIDNEHFRSEALINLVPHLPKGFWLEVTDLALAIQHMKHRSRALAGIAAHMPDELRGYVVQEALAAACAVQDRYDSRSHALAELAPHLAQLGYGAEALRAVAAISNEYLRADALIKIAPNLPRRLIEDALRMTQGIREGRKCADVLVDLSPYLPVALAREAVGIAYKIKEYFERDRALKALIPVLAQSSAVTEALRAARAIHSEMQRAEALATLVPYLPEKLLVDVLKLAREIRSSSERAQVLASLIPRLPEGLRNRAGREALEAGKTIQNEWARPGVLQRLALCLPHNLTTEACQAALEAAQAISDFGHRTTAYLELSQYLPDRFRREALQAARKSAQRIGDEAECSKAVTTLTAHARDEAGNTMARRAPEMSLTTTSLQFAEKWKGQDLQKALAAARMIRHEGPRGLYAGDYEQLEVYPSLWDSTNEWCQAEALLALARHLPEDRKERVLHEALQLVRSITNEDERANALAALASQLPDEPRQTMLPEALRGMRRILHENDIAVALRNLAPYLQGETISEAFDIALAIRDEWRRTEALVALAPYMSKELVLKVVEASVAIRGEENRVKLLGGLASALIPPEFPGLFPLWCDTLHRCAQHTRPDLLKDLKLLSPALALLGGREAILETAQALQDVGRWWP